MQYVAEYCTSYILDNSAYTIWTQGGTLDYDGYLAFVEDCYRHPGFDWAVIPDNISGTAADNDEWLARWPQHLKGVPVYHPHEPLTRLQRLAEQYDTVALGGSKEYSQLKTRKWWARINEMMAAVCDE